MCLWPLHKLNRVTRVIADTYQSVSGTGTAAVGELDDADARTGRWASRVRAARLPAPDRLQRAAARRLLHGQRLHEGRVEDDGGDAQDHARAGPAALRDLRARARVLQPQPGRRTSSSSGRCRADGRARRAARGARRRRAGRPVGRASTRRRATPPARTRSTSAASARTCRNPNGIAMWISSRQHPQGRRPQRHPDRRGDGRSAGWSSAGAHGRARSTMAAEDPEPRFQVLDSRFAGSNMMLGRLLTAMVTPFAAGRRRRLRAARAGSPPRWSTPAARALVVTGTTGEAPTLTIAGEAPALVGEMKDARRRPRRRHRRLRRQLHRRQRRAQPRGRSAPASTRCCSRRPTTTSRRRRASTATSPPSPRPSTCPCIPYNIPAAPAST